MVLTAVNPLTLCLSVFKKVSEGNIKEMDERRNI